MPPSALVKLPPLDRFRPSPLDPEMVPAFDPLIAPTERTPKVAPEMEPPTWLLSASAPPPAWMAAPVWAVIVPALTMDVEPPFARIPIAPPVTWPPAWLARIRVPPALVMPLPEASVDEITPALVKFMTPPPEIPVYRPRIRPAAKLLTVRLPALFSIPLYRLPITLP